MLCPTESISSQYGNPKWSRLSLKHQVRKALFSWEENHRDAPTPHPKEEGIRECKLEIIIHSIPKIELWCFSGAKITREILRYWIIMATVDNIENTHETGKSASVPASSKKHKSEPNCGVRQRKNQYEVWDHFEKLEEEEDQGDVDAVTEEMTYLDLNAFISQGGSNEPFQVLGVGAFKTLHLGD
ncbi:hypothetical protein Cgig2_006915 [Carnegiea gigantea]|uniref:Uncharacterized protein n=1 Tax=Carnegiea gigantea TaxID=171969 RepID=A0A9Q1JHZ0_9CARY|nr:hypothetical protein Cgig2_006915 [Carnegiea gigantea]